MKLTTLLYFLAKVIGLEGWWSVNDFGCPFCEDVDLGEGFLCPCVLDDRKKGLTKEEYFALVRSDIKNWSLEKKEKEENLIKKYGVHYLSVVSYKPVKRGGGA